MDEVIINKKLEEKILSNIPNDYTNLEKALLIYKRLCETLQYSLDCYLDEKNMLGTFTKIDNLKNVDGEENKDVVCFTFNAILIEMLKRAKVVQDIDHEGYVTDGTEIMPKHYPVDVTIDNINFIIDGTNGIIDNNDLVLCKYSTHKIQGWKVFPEDNAEQNEILNKSIERVYGENISLANNIERYLKAKDDCFDISLDGRMDLFLDFSKSAEYTILGFNKLLKLKHLLFTQKELIGEEPDPNFIVNQFVDFHFVKESQTGEFKALVFYNSEGFTNYKPSENADKLKIYELSLLNKDYKLLTREEVKKRYQEEYYVDRKGAPTMLPQIANDEFSL